MAVFVINFCLNSRYSNILLTRYSEMTEWIHLKLEYIIDYILEMICVFSDFKKIQNWRFYSRFPDEFLPEFKIVQHSSDKVLRDDWVD